MHHIDLSLGRAAARVHILRDVSLTIGHDGSTALISTSAASPLASLAMPRMVAIVDSEP